MKKILVSFVLGLVVGAGGLWFLQQDDPARQLEHTRDKAVSEAVRVRDSIRDTVGDMRVEDIREELERSSTVVREKAHSAGQAIADVAANARTSATIKAKFIGEPGLSAFNINVDTTDGLVTLSGRVDNHEQISRAVKIALETDGVNKVISTLQLATTK